MFKYLRNSLAEYFSDGNSAEEAKHLGIIYGALIVGLFTIFIAFVALRAVDETFGRDLDFEEEDN